MDVLYVIVTSVVVVGYSFGVVGTNEIFDKNGLLWAEEDESITYIKYVEISSQTWKKSVQTYKPVIIARFDNASITHMAVDARNRTIVLSDSVSQKIKAVTISNIGMLMYWDVFEGTSTKVNGLAIDQVTDIVYWTDALYDVIIAVSLFMPNMAQVIVDEEIDEPYGIATYPEKGFLFWTDIDESNPRLMRSSLGGKDIQTLLKFDKRRRGLSLFIDHEHDRVYWSYEINSKSVDSKNLQEIASCDIHGQSLKPITRTIATMYYDVGIFAEQLLYIEGHNINIYKIDMPNRGTKSMLGGQPKTLTIISMNANLNKPNHCNESLCPGLCTSSNTTVDCFCIAHHRGRSHWHKHYCRSKPFYGLLIPKADGIYTVKTNFIEYKPSMLSKIQPSSILHSVTPIGAVATDARGKKIYFYESGPKMIKSVGTKDNDVPVIVTLAIGKLGGMASDWNTYNLYWTDMLYEHIMVSKDDGRFPVMLHRNLKKPKAIAIHPFRRFLFWSELDGRIMRSYLDGSEKKEIYNRPSFRTVDITVDLDHDCLFVCTWGGLYELDMDGGIFQTHYQSPYRHHFTGITVYYDYIVLSDAYYKTGGLHVFDRTRRLGYTIPRVGSLTYPGFHNGNFYGVKWHHRGLNSNDKIDQDSCEQLTLMGKESVACRCSIGYTVKGNSCDLDHLSKPDIFLSDLRYNKLIQMFRTDHWESWQYVAVPVQAMRQPYSVAYDPVDKMVYWSDLDAGTITRALTNGYNQEIILYKPDVYFTDIFIDPGSRLLVYMMRHKPTEDYNYLEPVGRIVAYNMETGQIAPVTNKWLLDPYSLSINIEHGVIFFTEIKEVWRMLINGTEKRLIVTNVVSTLVSTYGPYLYYTNKINNFKTQIIRTDHFGHNATFICQLEGGRVEDLKVDEDYLYWINGSTRGVQKLRLGHPSEIIDIGPRKLLFLPTSFFVIPFDSYYDSTCSKIDCDGVCIPTPNEGTCLEADNTLKGLKSDIPWSGHCRIPDILNGDIDINKVGQLVPNGYRAHVTCYPAHTKSITEPMMCKNGQWTHKPVCSLNYTICGTSRRGYKIYTTSGPYFAHPEATRIEVICIGGGGGGYDVMNEVIRSEGKAGDGGTSQFGSYLKAGGGQGGSATEGGKGGYSHYKSGGDGSICKRGGIAGQFGRGYPFSEKPFCGTGGYSVECQGNQSSVIQRPGPGGSGGNWSTAGFFGGGAGAREGGTGGGGGFARITVKPDEKSVINVTVGRPGFPSYGHAGPGLVVVMWGGYNIDDFVENYDLINECVLDYA